MTKCHAPRLHARNAGHVEDTGSDSGLHHLPQLCPERRRGERRKPSSVRPHTWTSIATYASEELNDYLGSAGAGIEILCTENNSVSSGPGKQTTSLVNGLYYADSLGSLMQTEINSLVWWALHNGRTSGNNNSSLYGWRMYGDYGIEGGDNDQPNHDPYPVYYVQKLLTHFARGGDTVVSATSGNTLLTPYAVKLARTARSPSSSSTRAPRRPHHTNISRHRVHAQGGRHGVFLRHSPRRKLRGERFGGGRATRRFLMGEHL